MKITVLSGDDFKLNTQLHNDIIHLAQPSYEDASIVLSSALVSYDTAYLAHEDDGKLVSFFLAGHENISVEGQTLPSIHLGWTCSTQETKGSGIAQLVYKQFMSDSLNLQRALGVEFLLWGTTATPIGFHLYHKHFADVEPNYDGSYSPEAEKIAVALRERLGATNDGDHPFVLKGCNKARFSQQELARIEIVNQANSFSLFNDLDIDERAGDRLLVVCRLPSH